MTKLKNTTETPMTADPLLGVVISGCKFKYASYDFKKAYEEFKNTLPDDTLDIFPYSEKEKMKLAGEYMPKELKEKYRIWKVGKLRQIEFNPNGQAWRFRIGARYARSFYRSDFGVEVFPLV